MTTYVTDLRTGKIVGSWCLSPRQAVIAAYAQRERKDYNTWEYEERYASLVREGKFTVSVEDFAAWSDPNSARAIRQRREFEREMDLLLNERLIREQERNQA